MFTYAIIMIVRRYKGYGKEKPTVNLGKLDGTEVVARTEYPYTETLGWGEVPHVIQYDE